jgi:hypothetical protein
MNQASINVVANILGQTVPVTLNLSSDGAGQWSPSLAVAIAATGFTQSDTSNGQVVLPAGNGLHTGDKVDVFWQGGRRYGLTATVDGDGVTVTLAGGAGTDLPATGTAITVSKRTVINASFNSADASVLLVTATTRTSVVFVDAGGNVLFELDLKPGQCCLWWAGSGFACPIGAGTVAAIWVANGDSTNSDNLVISVMYEAVG